MYYNVHEALAEKIPLPDLIVYLRADTDVLMDRIATRDRPYERNMERDYIATLNDAYEEFFEDFYRGVPVLRLDTDQRNIVTSDADRAFAEQAIRDALAESPRQSELL
jgi:deoxyguanosine kinase